MWFLVRYKPPHDSTPLCSGAAQSTIMNWSQSMHSGKVKSAAKGNQIRAISSTARFTAISSLQAGNASTLHTRSTNRFGRDWERLSKTTLEKDGLVAFRHRLVHNGAVSVVLNVGTESLERTAPCNLAHLVACDFPVTKAV